MRFIFGRNDDAEAGARDELLSRMDAFWKELSAVGLERLEPSAARRQVAERLAELHPAIDCEVLERTLVLTPRGERRLRPWVNALVARAPELGGLTVAGASSPLVFADERSEGKDRAFLAGVAAGTLAGGVVGYLLTQPASSKRAEKEEERWAALPWAGVIGETRTVDGKRVPAMGAGVRGLW